MSLQVKTMTASTSAPPVHGCLTTTEWNRVLKEILSQPETVVLHTVILPPGFDRQNPALLQGEIIEERSYKLKPGEIPDFSKRPAGIFDAYIDNRLIPRNRPVPNFISVVSPEFMQTIAKEQSANITEIKTEGLIGQPE